MYGVTPAFLTAIQDSHYIATKVEVLQGGVPIAELEIVEGQVRIDADQPIRRRTDIRLTDPTGELTPNEAEDLLTPYGNELKLYRGVSAQSLGTTADELVPCGIFRISQVEVDDSGEGMILVINGFDRARAVKKARLENTYVISGGTNGGTALQNLILDGFPGAQFDFPTISTTLPRTMLDVGQDRWEAAMRIADALGYELFVNADGVFVMQAIPGPSTVSPVLSFQEGETSTLLYTQKIWDDEQIYNVVIITGESTQNGSPVRADAEDSNSRSPTFVDSFGRVPIFYTSPLISTVEQARAVAMNRLNKTIGLAEQVFFDALVNPALDVRDSVLITRAKSKIDAVYRVDSLTIPMSVGFAMPVTARRNTVA